MPKVQGPQLENHDTNVSKTSVQLDLPFCGFSVDITYWQTKHYTTQLEPSVIRVIVITIAFIFIITSLPLTKHFPGSRGLS